MCPPSRGVRPAGSALSRESVFTDTCLCLQHSERRICPLVCFSLPGSVPADGPEPHALCLPCSNNFIFLLFFIFIFLIFFFRGGAGKIKGVRGGCGCCGGHIVGSPSADPVFSLHRVSGLQLRCESPAQYFPTNIFPFCNVSLSGPRAPLNPLRRSSFNCSLTRMLLFSQE